jgi:hypothetical protein
MERTGQRQPPGFQGQPGLPIADIRSQQIVPQYGLVSRQRHDLADDSIRGQLDRIDARIEFEYLERQRLKAADRALALMDNRRQRIRARARFRPACKCTVAVSG